MPTGTQLATTLLLAVLTIIVSNVLGQVLFRDRRKPPVVFHVFPGIGSTVAYGQDPYAFFSACREKVCVLFFFFWKGCELSPGYAGCAVLICVELEKTAGTLRGSYLLMMMMMLAPAYAFYHASNCTSLMVLIS